MRMGQGVRTGLGHGGICVLQTQFSSFFFFFFFFLDLKKFKASVIVVEKFYILFPVSLSRNFSSEIAG